MLRPVEDKLKKQPNVTVTEDPWTDLRQFTEARIALGRCGVAPPLEANLEFKLAHAQARDAIYCEFDKAGLEQALAGLTQTVLLKSDTDTRHEYLTRPDKGRQLGSESLEQLRQLDIPAEGYDVSLIIADGLSPRAIHESAAKFTEQFISICRKTPLKLAPICIVENARVAIADEIGHALKAKVSVILIGERPGLSSPNSMGIYMTYGPRPGKTDESRNCISNVRPGGLSIESGIQKLSYLIETALSLKLSGVNLKDTMPAHYLPFFNTPMLEA